MKLKWDFEPRSVAVARKWNPVRKLRTPREQYPGDRRSAAVWQSWMGHHRFPPYILRDAGLEIDASVRSITEAFRKGDFIAAVVLTMAWGGMGRQKRLLIGSQARPKHQSIVAAFRAASDLLVKDADAERAWRRLEALGWSPVARSKSLHFLSRALGYTRNPPVPIDNAAILKTLEPEFKRRAKELGVRPPSWRGSSWEAYSAYMTVILTWAHELNWTTTQVETTIFDLYREERLVKGGRG